MLDIVLPGFAPSYVPYNQGWDLQRQIHQQIVAGQRSDTLILLEHDPVYTAGKLTRAHERPSDGTPVVDVDRGGRITWHGPGQLVGYPIVKLPEPIDVVGHVRRLEEILIDVLGPLGVDGYRVEGRSGVWVRRPLSEDKIVAIGVRVQRGVTMHGFALNCDNSLAAFQNIVPCGISDAGVTTISEVTGRLVSPAEISDAVAEAFRVAYSAVPA